MAETGAPGPRRALDGVRVLALETSLSGPHATKILADMGAEIIKIEKPGTLEILKRLAARVDVVLENFAPGAAERLGLGAKALTAANPRLIYCSLSGYGQDGPYRDMKAYDVL